MTDYTGNKIDDFKKLPKAAREFTCFIDLIIEEALKNLPDKNMQTYIRCHKKTVLVPLIPNLTLTMTLLYGSVPIAALVAQSMVA